MALQAINPASGDALATYEEMSAATAQGAIADAHQAHREWRGTTFRAPRSCAARPRCGAGMLASEMIISRAASRFEINSGPEAAVHVHGNRLVEVGNLPDTLIPA